MTYMNHFQRAVRVRKHKLAPPQPRQISGLMLLWTNQHHFPDLNVETNIDDNLSSFWTQVFVYLFVHLYIYMHSTLEVTQEILWYFYSKIIFPKIPKDLSIINLWIPSKQNKLYIKPNNNNKTVMWKVIHVGQSIELGNLGRY